MPALGPAAAAASAVGGVSVYGDGSDGNATISGTTTLTKDTFYDVLSVSNGGVLVTAGYRVCAKTSCTVDTGGKIHNDGGGAVSESLAGVATPNSGTLGNGAAGVAGGAGAGGAGTAISQSMGGNGGAGGLASGGSGGSAGTVTALTKSFPRAAPLAALGLIFDRSLGLTFAHGGASGGAGAGGVGANGGGSGAGGGSLVLAAKAITNNGTISANGGAGGARTSGTDAGGGGGGGGGLAVCVCDTFTGTNPTAAGGAGGAGRGTGVAGSNGSAGTAVVLKGV